ncbi:aldolase [Meiothermus sp. QL-1]|uniref:class I fructose-bisphosphate aldolase n=1 Tax=Meiothermus sp. QL-1 TaxID=2058095 RepID=UPI000E0A86CF|nr:aldolase [Meiothermus sp. QL-1]RDI94587.1 aldolase [Meiothermus sp. QL-1]
MVEPRLNRLFASDGRCLDVAVDHGVFGELSFLSGIENLGQAVRTLVEAGPDAIQLAPGQARLLQAIPGKEKPALVLRTDTTNVYGPALPPLRFSELVEGVIELALRLDAACVVVNLLFLPGEAGLYRDSLKNVQRLKAEAERYGMPLMVEPLAMQPGRGGYEVDGDVNKIVPLVRQAVELGADVIKADFTTHLEDYHRVVEAASGKPVLVRGGGRVDDCTLLERTYQVLQQGARGIVYGRNIIQHKNPRGMVRALMQIVHQGASPEEAMGVLASLV